MTSVSSAQILDPFSQLNQCFSTLASMVGSVFTSSENDFVRTTVKKRNDRGNFKVIDVFDAQLKKKVPFSDFTYIEDTKTGNLYKDEPENVIASKCAGIVLALPFFTLGKVIWHICKTPFEITRIALDMLSKIGPQLMRCRFYEVAMNIKQGCWEMLNTMTTGLFEIVKAPLFFVAVELAALYGIIRPYYGRKFEALLEEAWQQGISFKKDFRFTPAGGKKEGLDCISEGCVQGLFETEPHAFYLAHCFQVRGNTSSPKIEVLRRSNLSPNHWICTALA